MPEESRTDVRDGTLSQNLRAFSERISSYRNIDNITLRNTLKEVHNVLLSNGSKLEDVLGDVENLAQILIKTLTTDNEKCRELSATTLSLIFDQLKIFESCLPTLFSTLVQALGKTDEREKSEEVRLIEITLLHNVITNFEGDLLSHFNNISSILTFCIIDDCPEIKRKSCEALCILASKQESHFHMIASNFLRSLLMTVSHQHLKTRTLCIQAIGSIIEYLKEDEFDQAIRHISQRLFDRSPQVRLAVTNVIGQMLLTFKDRYSYFHRLIPLILSSIHDHVPDVRDKAEEWWIKAGAQYLMENEKDYKDLIDFPKPKAEDYPFSDTPNLGCRILVHRHIYNILPPLLRDIADWVPETQSKSAHVLYSLILHSEEKITIHLVSAIQGIETAAKSDNKECVSQATKSAQLLGYFVDPNLLFDSILTLVHRSPTASNISILAACLQGRSKSLPPKCFLEICRFLANPDICRIRMDPEQANLILCIEELLHTDNEINQISSYNIFVALVTVSGLTTHNFISKRAEELRKYLAEVQSMTEESLNKLHVFPFMKVLAENNELWTLQSPEMAIFIFVVQLGCIDEELVEQVFPILVNNLHPSKDAKLRSKFLTRLIPIFASLSPTGYEELVEKSLSLIRLGLFPNLCWAAGKTACSLRAVAAASLFEILSKTSVRKEILKSIGDELIPILSTLSEDDAMPTRLITCRILNLVLPEIVGCVDDIKIHNVAYEIMHCMDDESDDVRMVTTKLLKTYIKSFPADYNWSMYRSHLKHLYENVLIHMDDKNQRIKLSVFDLLKEGAYAAPDLLLDEVEEKRFQMAAGDYCDNLIDHVKSLKLK